MTNDGTTWMLRWYFNYRNVSCIYILFLAEIDFNEFDHSSSDSILSDYMTKINDLQDVSFPTRQRRIKAKQNPWITIAYINLAHKRDKMFKVAKASKSSVVLIKAKKLRNECTALSWSLKRSYFQNQINEYKDKPRLSWKHLKPLYKDDKTHTVSIQNFKDTNGQSLSNFSDIADAFNSQFTYSSSPYASAGQTSSANGQFHVRVAKWKKLENC